MLSPDDPRPKSVQVAAVLRAAVHAGEYGPGEQLPSTGELAERYGVARNTARRAVQVLSDEGLLVVRHGSGVFVHSSPPTGREEVEGGLVREVRELRASVDALLKRLGG